MTVDERIEALTMNQELAFRDIEEQRAFTKEFARTTNENMAKLTGNVEKLTGNIEALTRLIATDAENIRSLARIAEVHQQRLDRIDGGVA